MDNLSYKQLCGREIFLKRKGKLSKIELKELKAIIKKLKYLDSLIEHNTADTWHKNNTIIE